MRPARVLSMPGEPRQARDTIACRSRGPYPDGDADAITRPSAGFVDDSGSHRPVGLHEDRAGALDDRWIDGNGERHGRLVTSTTPAARRAERRREDDPGHHAAEAPSRSGPSGSATTRASRCCCCTAAPAPRTSTSRPSTAIFPAAGIEYYYYDQLGSYYSDQPDEPELWELPRFVDEVEQVRAGARTRQGQLLPARPVVGRPAGDRVRAEVPAAPEGPGHLQHDGEHPGVQRVRGRRC